jgi:hypothetical protein
MTRATFLATFGVAIALNMTSVCSAAPLAQGAYAAINAHATMTLIEEVHGAHRVCAHGWVPRWGVVRWHRHVGVAHVPVRC